MTSQCVSDIEIFKNEANMLGNILPFDSGAIFDIIVDSLIHLDIQQTICIPLLVYDMRGVEDGGQRAY